MSSSSSTTRMRWAVIGGLLVCGQLDGEDRSLARLAVHADQAAHRLDGCPRDVQAQAQTSVVTLGHGAFERLEQARDRVAFDPQPGVAHDEVRPPLVDADGDLDRLCTPPIVLLCGELS